MGSSGAGLCTDAELLTCDLRELDLDGGVWPMASSSDATSIASSPCVPRPPSLRPPCVPRSIPLAPPGMSGGGGPVSPASSGNISSFSGIGVSECAA